VRQKREPPTKGETWVDRDRLEVSIDRVVRGRVTYTEEIMLIIHDVALSTFMARYKKKEVIQ
jgi:hypothetical protein